MVFIDPFYNFTAAAMDGKWIRPRMGTDTAMAMATIAVGDVVYTITARQLMDEGHLAQLNIDIIQLEEDFKKPYKELEPIEPCPFLSGK